MAKVIWTTAFHGQKLHCLSLIQWPSYWNWCSNMVWQSEKWWQTSCEFILHNHYIHEVHDIYALHQQPRNWKASLGTRKQHSLLRSSSHKINEAMKGLDDAGQPLNPQQKLQFLLKNVGSNKIEIHGFWNFMHDTLTNIFDIVSQWPVRWELKWILVPHSCIEDNVMDMVNFILWTTLHQKGHKLWMVPTSWMYIRFFQTMNGINYKPFALS